MNAQSEKAIKMAFWWVMGLALLAFCFDLGNREPVGYDYRHAVIARLMLAKGFSWIPTLLDQPYAQKPPLFFWILYPIAKLTGSFSTATVVLPSALSAVGIVALIFCFMKRVQVQWAILSSLILITTYPFFLKARQSSIDMLLAFFVSLTLVGFFTFYKDKSRWGFVGMIFGLLAGWLAKGPISIVLPAAVILIYLMTQRDWKRFLYYGFGLGLLFVFCFVTWYGLCYLFLGKEFVRLALLSHTYGRVLEEPNKSFFYYVYVVLIMGLPWSFPLMGLFREKLVRGSKRERPDLFIETEKFCFIWFSVIFLFFTLVATKHLRYLIPVFPPMAVLAASFFVGEKDRWKTLFWKVIPWLVWGAVLMVIFLLCAWKFFPKTSVLEDIWPRTIIVGTALLFFFFYEFKRKRKNQSFNWVSLTSGLFCLLFFNAQFVEPTISYVKAPKEVIWKFEKINQRQNPLGFYHFERNDIFRYIYFSWRLVFPMKLEDPNKIPEIMRYMKYKRGHFVTYREDYEALPEAVKKDCVIMLSETFRDKEWIAAKWRDPDYP